MTERREEYEMRAEYNARQAQYYMAKVALLEHHLKVLAKYISGEEEPDVQTVIEDVREGRLDL